MKYRELLELYQNNELDEQTRREIEADIEKQEAISEFIFDRDETELGAFADTEEDQSNPGNEPDGEMFVKAIRSAVRRAFVKMGAIILALSVVIVLFIILILPRIVAAFYYNPGKIIAEDTNQMSLDLAVYTELTMPTNERNNVTVIDQGYGKYDISVNQTVSYNDMMRHIAGKIERNKLVFYDPNILRKPHGNAFAWYDGMLTKDDTLSEVAVQRELGVSAGGGKEISREDIESLSENQSYIAYVSLNKMMSYQEFVSYQEESLISGYMWCAVDIGNNNWESLGFQTLPMYSSRLNYDVNKYPELVRWNSLGNDDVYDQMQLESKDEAIMKMHFLSMLRYMAEQKQFLKLMDDQAERFINAATYVEENGLTVYGYITIGDKDTLMELIEQDAVFEIYTEAL